MSQSTTTATSGTTGNGHLELSPSEQQEIVWSKLQQHQLIFKTGGIRLAEEDAAGSDCKSNGTTQSSCPMDMGTKNKKPSNLEWPTYKTIMEDISNSDYNHVLECPHDMLHSPRSSSSLLSSSLSSSSSSSSSNSSKFQHQPSSEKFTKAFCPHGTICCAKMELFSDTNNDTGMDNNSNSNSYTGLLTPGNTIEHCIIRLSSAMKPPIAEKNKFGKFFLKATGGKLKKAKLFPMVAIKCFRQNIRSGNLLFAGRKIGQPSLDFFRHCLCTQMTERVPLPLKPFIQKFYSYSVNPLSLGVSDFCSSNEKGEGVEVSGPVPVRAKSTGADVPVGERQPLNFPYVLMIKPVYREDGRTAPSAPTGTSSKEEESSGDFDGFVHDLMKVPSGSVLFDLFACPTPHSALDAKKIQRIGRIVSTSEMIMSSPNDGLFFRHQKKEEDLELRPEWKEEVKAQCTPDGGKTVGTIDRLVGSTILEQLIEARQYIDFEK